MAPASGMGQMTINGSSKRNGLEMKNIYYLIWSDAILSIRKHHPHKSNWKIAIFVYITSMHAFNLWMVLLWLKYFGVFVLPPFNIDVFPGDMIDGFLSFAIEFASPFIILNYFLIFHNNRYEKIVAKYKDVKFGYAPIYSFTIAILSFASAILYGFLR